ncbi:hypothetical protein H1C71_028340, partial [Ictidomys tridecemlineatus]
VRKAHHCSDMANPFPPPGLAHPAQCRQAQNFSPLFLSLQGMISSQEKSAGGAIRYPINQALIPQPCLVGHSDTHGHKRGPAEITDATCHSDWARVSHLTQMGPGAVCPPWRVNTTMNILVCVFWSFSDLCLLVCWGLIP